MLAWKGQVQQRVRDPPQPRIQVSKRFLEMQRGGSSPSISLHHPSCSLSTSRPRPQLRVLSPPLLQMPQYLTGCYQEYRLSQLCP